MTFITRKKAIAEALGLDCKPGDESRLAETLAEWLRNDGKSRTDAAEIRLLGQSCEKGRPARSAGGAETFFGVEGKQWMPLYMTGAIDPYYYPKRETAFSSALSL